MGLVLGFDRYPDFWYWNQYSGRRDWIGASLDQIWKCFYDGKFLTDWTFKCILFDHIMNGLCSQDSPKKSPASQCLFKKWNLTKPFMKKTMFTTVSTF